MGEQMDSLNDHYNISVREKKRLLFIVQFTKNGGIHGKENDRPLE